MITLTLCFVNWSWKWDANWACTRWIRSYKHLRCNTEFPEFIILFLFQASSSFPCLLCYFCQLLSPNPNKHPHQWLLFGVNIPQMLLLFSIFADIEGFCSCCVTHATTGHHNTVLTHRTASKRETILTLPLHPVVCLGLLFCFIWIFIFQFKL